MSAKLYFTKMEIILLYKTFFYLQEESIIKY